MAEHMTLKEWLKSIGQTQQWLADQVGRQRSYISQIANGRQAGRNVAYAIEKLSDGKVSAKSLQLQGEDPLALCRATAA
jgi:transcriptional regulator with XRE-family HTH domain